MAPPPGLNVIALVSGGKDSFFSLLHCRANGHRVVALANLHPSSPLPVLLEQPSGSSPSSAAAATVAPAAASTPEAASAVVSGSSGARDVAIKSSSSSSSLLAAATTNQDGAPPAKPLSTPEASRGPGTGPPQDEVAAMEQDLNSFMYQTVGHQVIPLYDEATGIPLYRRSITGSSGRHGKDYGHTCAEAEEDDETESMIPLLKEIKEKHPEANALCAGAILSTYQRTRVESVATRLGLVPVAYLWKYPTLPAPEGAPPGMAGDTQLLDDMAAVGMEVRIIKVASGGLDESFLWTNLASVSGKNKVVTAMRRFGSQETGAAIGEGGEFETLVLDAPFFKKRVVITEGDRKVVNEGGGNAWLMLRNSKLEEKESAEGGVTNVRIPGLMDVKFEQVLEYVLGSAEDSASTLEASGCLESSELERTPRLGQLQGPGKTKLQQWCLVRRPSSSSTSIEAETKSVVEQIRQKLHQTSLTPSAIINTTILLRHMADFPTVNTIYGALFDAPNPPSRVTVSCGDLLASDPSVNIAVYLSVHDNLTSYQRQGLHVQSRSYWAPANIGPYSQAITIPVASLASSESGGPKLVSIAGQIPLIPATMVLPLEGGLPLQLTLSLQHLWRIGCEMGVQWWSSAVAYFPRSTQSDMPMSRKAQLASKTWEMAHLWSAKSSDEDDDEAGPDLWDRRFNPLYQTFGGGGENALEAKLPDWDVISTYGAGDVGEKSKKAIPPLFSAEVAELPRAAGVEWHAHFGFSGVEIGMVSSWKAQSPVGGDVGVYHCALKSVNGVSFLQTVVVEALGAPGERKQLLTKEGVNNIARNTITKLQDGGAEENVEGLAAVARYFVVGAGGMGVSGENGPVVPCASLWDAAGRALASVTIYQSVFDV